MNSIEEKTRVNLLIDLYGDLLTEKQLNYVTEYFSDDLSLSEIADNYDVSRNAVYDNIKRAIKILEEYEEKLHLLDKHIQRKKLIDTIEEDEAIDHSTLFEYLEKIRDL